MQTALYSKTPKGREKKSAIDHRAATAAGCSIALYIDF